MATKQAALCVFAKPPVAGRSKTRLAAKVGYEAASKLAEAFISDFYAVGCRLDWVEPVLATTEDGIPPGAFPLVCFPEGVVREEVTRWLQPDGDLGAKIEGIVRQGLDKGYAFVICTAGDAPGRHPSRYEEVRAAFDGGADAVLGPTEDGGCDIIAVRKCPEGLFSNLPWSCAENFEGLRKRFADEQGFKLVILSGWWDVDEVEDLERLRKHLQEHAEDAPSTAAVLAALDADGKIAPGAPLTAETAGPYAAAKLVGVVSPITGGALTAEEIHGGNLNYAFRVADSAGNAVFVKQAPDFIKCLGPEAKLERERMKLEVAAFGEWSAMLGAEVAEKYLPQIYKVDLDNMAFIMEFLGSYELLQKSLFRGHADKRAARSLGEIMGLMHGKSHVSVVSAEEAARLGKAYANEKLRGIQLHHVYTKPWTESDRPEAKTYLEDVAFASSLEEARSAYRGEQADNLALCHGDLHPGSAMVDESTAQVKIIDPEFAVYGPPGVDLGSMLSGYISAYVAQVAEAGQAKSSILEAIKELVASYRSSMLACGVSEESISRASEDAVGLGGCNVAQEMLGFAGARVLPVKDADLRRKAEDAALALTYRCIKGRKGKGIELLIAELEAFSL